ncbi:MAG: cobalamin biosynthesis protein CobD [Gemmatimonadaceae bacterium]|nr:cobalamin biosynthesis protein CobD [Gemmatimonadaceae bacterium]
MESGGLVALFGGVLADTALGDPRWLPHPVRGIGRLAATLERATRAAWPGHLGVAGATTATGVLFIVGGLCWVCLRLCNEADPALGLLFGAILIYVSIAARDLIRHSRAVLACLAAGDLPRARVQVGMLVGRDTAHLSESEIVRATVESVAESIVDGVLAPLFWACVLGPLAAILYRAANTLDSMFGHRNERYERFGRASARLDDAANYLPARVTTPLICLAAGLLGLSGMGAWSVWRRDRAQHPSPNSGHAEAAVAGALGVRLGGVNRYQGVPSSRPFLGDPLVPLQPHHITAVNRLVWTTLGLSLLCMLGFLAVIRI